jgi:hypothetical protein
MKLSAHRTASLTQTALHVLHFAAVKEAQTSLQRTACGGLSRPEQGFFTGTGNLSEEQRNRGRNRSCLGLKAGPTLCQLQRNGFEAIGSEA